MVATRSASGTRGAKRTISQAFQPTKVARLSSATSTKDKGGRPVQAASETMNTGMTGSVAAQPLAEAALTGATSNGTIVGKASAKAAVKKASRQRAHPKAAVIAATEVEPLPILSNSEIHACTTLPMPNLPFSLSHGKAHLIKADPRFERLLDRIPLRVYEELAHDDPALGTQTSTGEGEIAGQASTKELDLFKTLVTSIMGQQVSWLAARAILYKFIRLWYHEELPEKPDFATRPRDSLPFPTPLQVRNITDEKLRSAGLSGQKVRYVRDIAERFTDGRLDVRQLIHMDEEAVLAKLCEIKGVGVWTAQMILIFALRRPDILPVGDLGVQKGMVLLWASGAEGPAITSSKARPAPEVKEIPEESKTGITESDRMVENVLNAEESRVGTNVKVEPLPSLDAHDREPKTRLTVPPLPPASGLKPATLQARKNGQKVKGKVYLSAEEMEALSESWRPYRSLASVVMWALVDS